MRNLIIKLIEPTLAKQACHSITETLPEWFGIPESNERYEQGMLSRVSFSASISNNHLAMITLEFPYPNNANIYWMAVKKNYHGTHIGTKLLQIAENYCRLQGCSSLTVETVSAKQNDNNYLKTYHFYEKSGFKPLFEMYTYDPENLMVYMQKSITLDNFSFIDLTHTLSAGIPHWGTDCGFQHKIEMDYADCPTEVKFRAQRLQMAAGIGTHMDAPAHCIPGAPSIADIPLQSLIVPCNVIDVSARAHEHYRVTVDDILAFENEYGIIPKGTFIIVYTGWDLWWNEPAKYRNELIFPSISKEAAEVFLARDIVGLGIDTLSPDACDSGFPVHQLILGAGKYIIENIANAKKLEATGNHIIVMPIKIGDGTEAPIRLVGVKNQ